MKPPLAPTASPWRDRRALLALAPIGLAVLALAVVEPWHSNLNVDTMTFFEQVRAVAQEGSLGFDNGPVARFPQLLPRWFVPARGRAWGILPAPIAYVLAPAERFGGFAGVVRAILGLFALAAVATYALAYRLTRRPVVAVGAAYVLAAGSSLGLWTTAPAPFVPCAALGITGIYLANRALDEAASWRRGALLAAGAGLCESLALGSHLLWSAPWAAIGAALVLARGAPARRAARAACYALASAPCLALMGAVNHVRFGTWNPVSYGPCDSGSCVARDNQQTLGAFAHLLLPALPFALAVVLALWLVRRSTRGTGLVVGFAALGALIPEAALPFKLRLLLRTAWGYVVDVGSLEIALPHGDHALGSFNGPFCARALLQCSPVLAAALLARAPRDGDGVSRPDQRATVAMLAGACGGVLLECAARAGTGGFDAFGYPFVNFRYVATFLPAATVLAALALHALPWRAWHAALAGAVALAGGLVLGRHHDDTGLLRREVTLWLPLALAAALVVCTVAARDAAARGRALWPRVAAALAAVCVGYGGAVVLGVDRVVATVYRGAQDARVDALARCTPARFVLVGDDGIEDVLALRDRRDIYFANLAMRPTDWTSGRALIASGVPRDYPVFLLASPRFNPHTLPWPRGSLHPLPGCRGLYRVLRAGEVP